MTGIEQRWTDLYHQTPLCDVPRHFANIANSPFLTQYLETALRYCPRGGSSLETGVGSGHGAIWLSLRGVRAEGIDLSLPLVERARQINNVLGGVASFEQGDLFHLFDPGQASAPLDRYDVVHHQGVLEHFTVPQIRAALAQQVASAHHVVFSVPSVYYPFDGEFGDERLLPLEEWQLILEPFDIEELRYHGDPSLGGREHILCVLRGQPVDDALRALMVVSEQPYLPGISAIVHTRNEERHIAQCLETLQGWTDEIIVCDMESSDATVEIARGFTDRIIAHPRIPNFDRARNVSAMRAAHSWVFYLDADERVPAALGRALRDMTENHGETFEGLLIPFRHHFTGHWMRSLYPGYTAPRLYKNGKFHFNARLHAGSQVDGRITLFPANNPELALTHYSFDSLSHYLSKLNGYTDGEAGNMHRDGQPFHWKQAIGHFVRDFRSYYDGSNAAQDGVHGFLYSFLSGFYRFEQHAKLFELRHRSNQLQPHEVEVPASAEEVLEYALAVLRAKPLPRAAAIPIQDTCAPTAAEVVDVQPAEVVWSGPVLDSCGYGEESRNFVLALDSAGATVSAHDTPWSGDTVELAEDERKQLSSLLHKPTRSGFVHIQQNFPPSFQRHPQAAVSIGRTMFETDRLPQDWVKACNGMDYIWIPSEFNRESFAAAGVAKEKLVVMPGCFDPAPFLEPAEVSGAERDIIETACCGVEGSSLQPFVFLTVFDWTRHKGWDVLLRALLEEFAGREDVVLVLKVWSTMGYDAAEIRRQAHAFAREELGVDLEADSRVRFVDARLSRAGLTALYQRCDAFVLPSRGEGWGRPYMEAMACAKPVIGTRWSGNLAFMTDENSYLIDCEVADVPEHGWREIPTYRGHRWAEPDLLQVRRLMREVVDNPEEAVRKGALAQEHVTTKFNREAVGELMRAEIERVCTLGGAQKTEKTDPSPLILPPSTTRQPVRVRWEGAQFSWHSLGHVNREMSLGLLDTEGVELSLVPTEPNQFGLDEDPRFPALAKHAFATLSGPCDVHVRHFFPPRMDAPDEGHLVLIQPWEYGYLPERWIEPVLNQVEEVWCYSEYVRQVYLASGIPEEKLQVVPLGVDTEVFHPAALPYVFTDEAGASKGAEKGKQPFTFLFVGGTLHRKGIDILLEAYQRAFTAMDNVRLVIKDFCTETAYRGQNERERILSLIGQERHPSLVYVDRDLSAHELAGLYTASDCLVQPYRGEGFCLPALEALACGIPVVVPDGGPTDDFVDDSVGWRIEAEHRPFAIGSNGRGVIGEWECAGPTWQFEVEVERLARLMREIAANPAEAQLRGEAGAIRAKDAWSWRHSCAAAEARLRELQARPVKATRPKLHAVPAPKAETGEESPLALPDGVRAERADRLALQQPRGHTAPTISLCMIVRDEERVLGACLESIKPHVDEIIVVDTGSTDRTVEIAEEHGARVLHFPWTQSFSEARNVSIEHATGDWILWMDADDTIPEACGKGLKDAVMLAADRVTGLMMQVHIPPAPGESGFTIVDHVKLFRNRPALRFEGRIHEQILEAIYRDGGQIERTPLYVVHSGYDYSPEGQVKKRERDLTLLQKDLEERPDHPFVLFNIGMTAYHMKDFAKAVPALERCLAVSRPNESTVRKVYAMLAGCHLETGDAAGAKATIEIGLSKFPRDPELLFRAGIIYAELGELEAAERSYITLLTAREVGHIDSIDVSMTGFKAHHNLAHVYLQTGRVAEAEAHLKAAVQDNATFVPSWLGLGDLYLRTGRVGEAYGVVKQLQALAPDAARNMNQRLEQISLLQK